MAAKPLQFMLKQFTLKKYFCGKDEQNSQKEISYSYKDCNKSRHCGSRKQIASYCKSYYFLNVPK